MLIILLCNSSVLYSPTSAFVIARRKNKLITGEKNIKPYQEKQQVRLNELFLANANRLEQVHQEVQNQNFEEAKAILALMRDSLNVFYRDSESIEQRKQIREQQRQLDPEAKIRDMDNFLAYFHYEETKNK